MTKKPALRVLHIVGKMDRGGAETWLMHVLRTVDRSEIQLDFLVHTDSQGAYDEEITQLGSNIFNVGSHRNPLSYALRLRKLLTSGEPYDIVHSHVGFFTGYVLLLCRILGIGTRIAHSHNASRQSNEIRSSIKRLYVLITMRLISRNMTQGLAASEAAAESMFGVDWRADSRVQVMYCGVDLSQYDTPVDREVVRGELGIDESPLVIGHVGRLAAVKNHKFLLRVFKLVLQVQPDAKLVFVGVGPMKLEIESEATQMGVGDNLLLLGERSDVPRLLKGAFDVFAFPSEYEGLGLAYVEAQAAGLMCVVSDSVPRDADVLPDRVVRLPLADEEEWAQRIVDFAGKHWTPSSELALRMMRESAFNIETSVLMLRQVYDTQSSG